MASEDGEINAICFHCFPRQHFADLSRISLYKAEDEGANLQFRFLQLQDTSICLRVFIIIVATLPSITRF